MDESAEGVAPGELTPAEASDVCVSVVEQLW